MLKSRILLFCCAVAAVLISSDAAAQSTIVPSDPVQFERISLRQTVDSCTFNENNVSVFLDRETIKVVQPPFQCFAPGSPEVVDIQLGAYPAGEYRVEVYHALNQPPLERVDFVVHGIGQAAVFPPPLGLLANYSGIWWTPTESGWGLSLHQGNLYTLFGALYVHGADQQPQWYTLGSGRWVSMTRWTGEMLATTGPFWAEPSWDPSAVKPSVVGTVSIDFSMTPGHVDRAELVYSIAGTTVTKQISRIRF